MILTIHDNNLQKVAFIDNNKQGALNFYNDKWTRFLSKASSLFEFTVFKKSIQSDLVPYQTANALNDQSFVSFKYKGKTYLFHVMTIEETEQTITCTCKDLNLELTNEYTNPYKSDRPRSFREYCDVMGLLDFAALRIGINEISDLQRTLEWEGQDTKLNRILSLANKFDAEVDFEVRLNANGTIKDFVLNVYHEHDDKHQGVGKVRSDIILKKGKNIRSIKRTTDKTDLIVNAIRPTARGENGQELTIGGLGKWEIRNENGEVEFFQQGEFLYAPLSMQKYSSTWTGSTGNRDKYTRKDLTVDTDSKEMLRTQAYKELMRSAYPSVSYEIDGYVDLEIGDTAKVYNSGFYPALLLEVRVSEQIISFTNPAANKTVFDNIRALKSKLSSGIQERWQELFEASKPYTIRLSTDNGTVFKNGKGQSIVSPTLLKGGKVITADVSWRWALDGAVKTGMTYTVRGADVTGTSILTVSAYIGNTEVATNEITIVNVSDGRDGRDGAKGDKGDRGATGPAGPQGVQGLQGPKGALDEAQVREINDKLDGKADQAWTQEQMNMFYEQNALIEAEVQAKLSMERFSEWETKYLADMQARGKAQAKAEADLIEASRRIEALVIELGGMKEMKKFIDTYMSSSNEGLILGTNDGSSTIKVSHDRISMYSAGTEVMYISQGVLHIDNGIFTKTLQIGRFRIEQHRTNPDMNVCYYVGPSVDRKELDG
ncbi:TPA: phage tail protein [Streptococcus suis]|nr:phage tail protein [Streptococcus suis]HEM3699875.1 phage tail protein [Streptococcus suis]